MIDFDAMPARAFLTRLWQLQNHERPGFIIGYVGPRVTGGAPVRSALFSTEGKDTVRDRLLDPEKFLQAQLEEIAGQIKLRGDYVPALCPTLGVIGIPSAFGCDVVWWDNDFPSVRPVPGDDPDRIFDLIKPSVSDGALGRILTYTRYFIDRTGSRYPIRLTDIQGPLDSAGLVFGHNNLFLAMQSQPQAVHHLLQMITDLTIEFARAQRDLVLAAGCEFVPSLFQPWLPDGQGISISNDDCVMISAPLHNEFSVPYLNQISAAFGGIYLHSCGNWAHQFSSLEKIHHLRGLEFGASETPYDRVLDHWGGRVVLACRVGFHQNIKFTGMADYVQRILSSCKTFRGLFINVDITNGCIDSSWPATDLIQTYRMLENP